MILLYCDHESGQSALQAACINGIEVGQRRYNVRDHFVEVDGAGYNTVALHDAEHLCQHAIYRLATPEEQDAYRSAADNAQRLREEASKPTPAPKKEPARKSNGG